MIDPITAIASTVGKILDKIFPDAGDRARAELALLELRQRGELDATAQSLSAILAEAQSTDPWTSRARPTFMYVMYFLILSAVPMGILHYFDDAAAAKVTEGVGNWLIAIPEPMWWLFGAGYLGYTAGRSFDKWKGK